MNSIPSEYDERRESQRREVLFQNCIIIFFPHLSYGTVFQPPIYFLPLIRARLLWQQAREGSPDVPLPSNIFQLLLEHPKVSPDIWSLQCVLGFQPGGHAKKTSKGSYLGDIPIRCPNHLNSLLSTRKCSGSPTSSMKMSEPIFKDHCTQPCWGNLFWLLASTVSYFGPLP